MSKLYPEFQKSVYPDELDTFEYMSDVTADLSDLINQYKTYYNNKDIAAANQLLIDHPELNNCMLNAEKINKIIDSLKCIEKFYMESVQTYLQNIVVYRGDYDSSISYNKYNVMNYNGETFMCIKNGCPIGTIPTNKDYFVGLVIKGSKGDSGLGLSPRGIWNQFVDYQVNDMVSYNNALWACNRDNIGYYPNDSSNIWYCVLSPNILSETMKVQNSEIDAILDGSAVLTDGNTGTSEDDYDSISRDEIDNVLNN